MHPPADLLGRVFGRLTVVGLTRGNGMRLWQCVCQCGVSKLLPTSNLTGGTTRSCGCLNAEQHRTHGMTLTPTYKAWSAMLQRCTNPRCSSYRDYGVSAATVSMVVNCHTWKNIEQEK